MLSTIPVNDKEFTTILAGLRYLQANYDDAKEAMSDLNMTTSTETKSFLLTPKEIDKFCEKINFGG